MVPGSFGCGSAVLAAITMLAPSRAAFRAIALPIPRLPPVMNRVNPDSFLENQHNGCKQATKQNQRIKVDVPCVQHGERLFSRNKKRKAWTPKYAARTSAMDVGRTLNRVYLKPGSTA